MSKTEPTCETCPSFVPKGEGKPIDICRNPDSRFQAINIENFWCSKHPERDQILIALKMLSGDSFAIRESLKQIAYSLNEISGSLT